jgi:NAD(P)-dependent dehydrogenase (short-subunit alcohol dehydrogenase family)
MSQHLSNKVVRVTGGNSGIGKAAALMFPCERHGVFDDSGAFHPAA